MTHSDFNHLLSSIKALSPEQVRQLRQQLDQPARPAEEAYGSDARQGRQTRQARRSQKKPLTCDEFNQQLLAARPHHPPARSIPRHRRRRSRTISRSPSRESRCRKPSSASGAEVVDRLLRRFQRPGQTLRPGNRHRLGAPPHAPQPIHDHLHRPHHRRRSHLAPSPAAAKAGRSPPPGHRRSSAASASISPGATPSSRSRPPCSTRPCGWRIRTAFAPTTPCSSPPRSKSTSSDQAAGFAPVTLISADQALNDAATAEGLTVDDPNRHP